jgi:hypothetical protein
MKKITAILLTAALLLATTACDNDGRGGNEALTNTTMVNSTASAEELVHFGGSSWRVLDVEDGKTLVISEDVLEKRRFDAGSNEWSSSEIRSYLNGEFMNRFSAEERAKIVDTNGDHVFLLSVDEVNSYFTDDNSRIAFDNNEVALWWWLRSPGTFSFFAAYVNRDGSVYVNGYDVDDFIGGVRPALWLNL